MHMHRLPFEVLDSFRPDAGGFVSIGSLMYSSPPYVIASRATEAIVAGYPLPLPDGYNAETLRRISTLTGWREQPVRISRRQAQELALIGRSLLEAHTTGDIPLAPTDRDLIEVLLDRVSDSSTTRD
jgi:hypothetical protein